MRERTAEALNTVKVAMGEALTTAVQCDKVEVEAVLSEQISGNAYNSDEVSQWAAQVCTPFFKDARPRTNEMVVPYLKAIMSEAEAIINGEKFLETGATKFGAGQEEEVVEPLSPTAAALRPRPAARFASSELKSCLRPPRLPRQRKTSSVIGSAAASTAAASDEARQAARQSSTAAASTPNLATNPPVNGTPACPSSNTVNAPASTGRRRARPR